MTAVNNHVVLKRNTTICDDGIIPIAAYSVRKINPAYSGNCLKIIRASDSTQLDIGFTVNNEIDVSAIAVFLKNTTGKVVTWYDQSGNSYDLTQATDSKRAGISLNITNDKPALVFSGAQTYAAPAGLLAITQGANTMFAVANSNNDTTVQRICRFSNLIGGAGVYGLSFFSTTQQCIFVEGNSNITISSVNKAVFNVLHASYTTVNTTTALGANNAAEVTGTTNFTFISDAGGWIGSTLDSSQYLDGKMHELIFYNTKLTSTKTTSVIANMKLEFSTP